MKRNLNSIVSIRFSSEEFIEIGKAAKAHGEKYVTSFIRKVVMDCMRNEFDSAVKPTTFNPVNIVPVQLQKDKDGNWYLCPSTKYARDERAIREFIQQRRNRFIALKERNEISALKAKLNKAIGIIERELK